jgi:hypothetical protein
VLLYDCEHAARFYDDVTLDNGVVRAVIDAISGRVKSFVDVKDGAELQIDLDEEGHSDCLSYAAALDLSKLRLVVNDLNKLNTDCKYVIATNLTSCANAFASSNLPNGWYVKQSTSGGRVSLTLAFKKGTTFIVR